MPVRPVEIVYNEAEKGTIEDVSFPSATAHDGKDEKHHGNPVSVEIVQIPSQKASPQTPPIAKNPAKPAKKKVSKWILWVIWFNTYRKFFTFTVSLNMIGLILAASGHFPYAVKYSGAMVVGNFNFSVLMRNEIFGRILYLFVNTCFAKWTPLWWRLGCTSVLQHLGGIHSGCAVSGIAWLILKVVHNFIHHNFVHESILVVGIITSVIVVVTAASAFPWVRNTHHNVFERHHRFAGWSSLVATWAYVLLSDLYDEDTQTWNLSGAHIARQQDFWYVIGMTILIALPWFFIRQVPVDIEMPSPKVAVLRFKRGMQQGLLGRISRSAVLEYHAFGTISLGKDAEYHYMICGVQGDFTRSLVNNPPKTIWTRELKFAGVSNTSTLYKRGIRICTGTGLGAALSTCLQSKNWYLIWIGSDQEKTFGPTISGLIRDHIEPERYLLWDSKQRGGRPDSVKLVKDAYEYWKAEVVFITSNMQGNTEIMEGCKEAGIPVFGTLWDF